METAVPSPITGSPPMCVSTRASQVSQPSSITRPSLPASSLANASRASRRASASEGRSAGRAGSGRGIGAGSAHPASVGQMGSGETQRAASGGHDGTGPGRHSTVPPLHTGAGAGSTQTPLGSHAGAGAGRVTAQPAVALSAQTGGDGGVEQAVPGSQGWSKASTGSDTTHPSGGHSPVDEPGEPTDPDPDPEGTPTSAGVATATAEAQETVWPSELTGASEQDDPRYQGRPGSLETRNSRSPDRTNHPSSSAFTSPSRPRALARRPTAAVVVPEPRR